MKKTGLLTYQSKFVLPVSTFPGRVSILRNINLFQCSYYSKHFWNFYFVIIFKTKLSLLKIFLEFLPCNYLQNQNANNKIPQKQQINSSPPLFHLLKKQWLFCMTVYFLGSALSDCSQNVVSLLHRLLIFPF